MKNRVWKAVCGMVNGMGGGLCNMKMFMDNSAELENRIGRMKCGIWNVGYRAWILQFGEWITE